ncbi:MAG: prephenate dehydrogenase/arogenate dehydrogenase family protein [Bdellovibrionota bacterium]
MRVAFLGPEGTNTDLAFRELLKDAKGEACYSISEVFNALLEGKVDAGFVPIENMIQGPVTETLDQLFRHQGRIFITDSHITPIRNGLGVLPDDLCGVPWPREIRAVYSHEQALRQCGKYLSEHFPRADRLPEQSTVAAIRFVKRETRADAAVIAPPASLAAEGFSVLADDISDVPGNKTRFVLLKRGSVESDLPSRKTFAKRMSAKKEPLTFLTSIVLDPQRDRKGLLVEILNVISVEHHINLVTIHSRPDTRGGVRFYLDLEGHPEEPQIQRCLQDLRRFCANAMGQSTAIHILGAYPRSGFYNLPFKTLGIIGDEGVMGRWFRRFFESVGLEVIGRDKESGLSMKDLAARSDVILLSVPMSSAEELAAELLPYLRDGQLVVENCSIKSCVLPGLIAHNPGKIEILGLHTMFGGDRETLQGENVIITRTTHSGTKAQAFEDLLYKHGARIHHSSIEQHDRIASFVQSVVQLNMLVLADVMSRNFESLDELDFMTTPNFRNTLQVMTRVLAQSDELISDLQMRNDKAVAMRHRFLESAFRAVSRLDNGDIEEFMNEVRNAREFVNRKK